MRSSWRRFIQPENAIGTNRKGSRNRVIAEVTRSPSRNRRPLDLRCYPSDRVFGHYEVGGVKGGGKVSHHGGVKGDHRGGAKRRQGRRAKPARRAVLFFGRER